jgi:chaperonin cofactor prefoldin
MVRRAYIRKVEDRLERLENKIDYFRKQMAAPVGDIREKIEQEIRDLRAKAEVVRKKIRAVEASEASAWGRHKSAVDDGLKELEKVVDEAIERFRKTGTGDR